MLKASEDKTFPGAIVASLASPWGQAISAGDPQQHVLRLLPRGVRARPLRGVDRAVADGDLATARDATLFLFERQQLPDGSMPRNSLVNGKTAPDSFGDAARRGRLPDPDGRPARADRRVALRRTTSSRRRTSSPRTARLRRRALGGAERLLAVDDRGRDRRARRRGRTSPQRNGDAGVGRRLARRRRRLAALDQGLDGDDERAARAAPYFIRLSKTGDPNAGDLLQRRQRRPDARPARRDRRRLPRARPARRAARRTTRTSSRSLPVVDATIESTTASGPGWHRYNGDGYGDGAGRRPSVGAERTGAPATSGRCCRPSAASSISRPATRDGGRRSSLGMSAFASGVGLIPEQDWELPDLAASPYGTDPTIASIGFAERRRRRARPRR